MCLRDFPKSHLNNMHQHATPACYNCFIELAPFKDRQGLYAASEHSELQWTHTFQSRGQASIWLLICVGCGLNKVHCLKTSSKRALCSSRFLDFMILTMAASMTCFLSTGASARVVVSVAFSSFLIKLTWTLIFSLVKPLFTSNLASSAKSFPEPSCIRTLCRDTVKDITCRLHSSSGSLVASTISLRVTWDANLWVQWLRKAREKGQQGSNEQSHNNVRKICIDWKHMTHLF